MLNVKQNNWTTTFQSTPCPLPSIFELSNPLNGGLKKWLFGWFKCFNGFTLVSKLGFNILLNVFTTLPPSQTMAMWENVYHSFTIFSCYQPYLYYTLHTTPIKFWAMVNVCLSIFVFHIHAFSDFFLSSLFICSNIRDVILKFWWICSFWNLPRFIGTYCVNYHFSVRLSLLLRKQRVFNLGAWKEKKRVGKH